MRTLKVWGILLLVFVIYCAQLVGMECLRHMSCKG
jgi:hypothetical protein